jgi:dynactin complex subunit
MNKLFTLTELSMYLNNELCENDRRLVEDGALVDTEVKADIEWLRSKNNVESHSPSAQCIQNIMNYSKTTSVMSTKIDSFILCMN